MEAIGKLIKEELARQERSVAWFARKLSCHRTNVYDIFARDNIDMTLLIPVDKAGELGVRAVVSSQEAQKAIASMSGKPDPLPADWKLRYQRNQDLIRKGTIAAIAKVVQSLYHRSKVKELPIQERKLYENALGLLIDEASCAMRKDRDEISSLILSKLEK